MANTIEETETIEERRQDAIPFWLMLCSPVVGAVFLSLVLVTDPAIPLAVLMYVGAGTGFALFAFALGERLWGGFPKGLDAQADASFFLNFGSDPDPIAKIDERGRILHLNTAATEAVNGRRISRIEEVFAGVAKPAEFVFQLLNEARADERTERSAPFIDGREAVVSVWNGPLGTFLMRWRLSAGAPVAVAAAGVNFGPSAPQMGWLRADASGRITEIDDTMSMWLGEASALTLGGVLPDVKDELIDLAAGRKRRSAPGSVLQSRIVGVREAPDLVGVLAAPIESAPGVLGGGVALSVISLDSAVSLDAIAQGEHEARFVQEFDSIGSMRIFEDAPVGVVLMAEDGVILRTNAAADRLLGARGAEVAGRSLTEYFLDEDQAEAKRRIRAVRGGVGEGPAFEGRIIDGEERRDIQVFMGALMDDGARYLVAFLVDASEQRDLEDRFRKSQRLRDIGDLAGGIAHDFNNLLTVIMSVSEKLSKRHAVNDPDFADLDMLRQNAVRARDLVSKLLAVSRQQTLKPRMVVFSEKLNSLVFTLDQALSEKIKLEPELADDLWPVWVDEGEFERVIMNLVLNARDALGGVKNGGRVTLRAVNQTVTPKDDFDDAMPPGEYVRLDVEDNGSGMPPEVMERIFQPFFTTKDEGKGTGLGLAMAYGFIKQSGGFIFVDSQLGEGARFSIFLPRHIPSPEELKAVEVKAKEPPQDLTGDETILLVEDEDGVRRVVETLLKDNGYNVLCAFDGEEALEILSDPNEHIDLMISDVIMPNLDGPNLLLKVIDKRPDLKTLFISGYTRDLFSEDFEDQLAGRAKYGYLQKPFENNSQLLEAVSVQLRAN